MNVAAANSEFRMQYRGLRGWLEQVEKMGELQHVDGAHWDVEMGAITHMLTEKSRGNAPAILFDNVPGYAKGFRTLYGQLSSIRRIALTLGLPLEHDRKVDIVQRYHQRMQELRPLPPREVKDGPILENVLTGDAVDVLKFPVPRHHELDTARFIGTADCVITRDPDDGWFNLGAYRSQVYDGKTVGCQITEGKHGRIHRDTYFERGEPMKVVILCGQDPLLFMLSSSPLPEIGEMDIAGGLRGEPIDVVRGPYSGFPIPADCEIALEGETVPGQVRPEGPFGEWMGYYSDDTVPRPYVTIKSILHRNNPILTCAPQHKPVDETGLLKGIAGAAQIWRPRCCRCVRKELLAIGKRASVIRYCCWKPSSILRASKALSIERQTGPIWVRRKGIVEPDKATAPPRSHQKKYSSNHCRPMHGSCFRSRRLNHPIKQEPARSCFLPNICDLCPSSLSLSSIRAEPARRVAAPTARRRSAGKGRAGIRACPLSAAVQRVPQVHRR
jgi:UbiD family decarboxylase